ncbi:hypothetical protein Tco_0768633 [Tanacetum coccineum]
MDKAHIRPYCELDQGELIQGKIVQGKLIQGELVQGELIQGELVQGELIHDELVQEHEEEEEENVDEFTDKEDDVNNANENNEEELDDDQHNVSQESEFEQEEEDAHVTLTVVHDTQQTEGPMQSSPVSSDFTEKLLNFENVSPADNEIASLMDTTVRHEEPNGQTSTPFTVPITTIPPIPHFFNPFPQQTTPTPTPTTLESTTSFPALPDFSSVFKFNDRVTKLETGLSEMKQVYQYAQAISSIPAIVDRYINNKLGEAILKAIQEEVKTQLPQILSKAVSNFATPMIERNVIESLEAVVLARSSSQPKSTYEVAASLSEYELTKILLDTIEESKSHLRADCKRKLYDALVESYNTDKDLFDTYGKVFTLKRSRDEKDKDQDPSAGSDRGNKRRKSSKEAESTKDPRSKERKSSSSSKGTSRSHHKSSSKSAHAEEPSHTVDDSGVQKNQEFNPGNNDEQPDDEAASKNDCVTARAKKPPTSFDELINTPIDFSAFFMNRLNITNLTQELLVGPHNPEGKPYPFDLRKPLPLIPDHRGRQVIPQDYFINNDLEYLKGGSLSRQYSTSVTKTKAATYEIKWIKDMVPDLWSPLKVLTNLTVDEHYDLNVALRMFTRRIVIQRRLEDLQLGVESYQKKLNLTKIDTFRLNLRNKSAYTAYSDPQGVIYKDQNNRNKLMRTDKLHKFSDGTLNDVRTALHDIASGIRMEYLPKRK